MTAQSRVRTAQSRVRTAQSRVRTAQSAVRDLGAMLAPRSVGVVGATDKGINPLWVRGSQVEALDALIVPSAPRPE